MSFLMMILVNVAIAGFIAFLVDRFVPMAPIFQTVFRALCVIGLIYWLLGAFGLLPAGFPRFH
jgi:hypothetical protein